VIVSVPHLFLIVIVTIHYLLVEIVTIATYYEERQLPS
jgi:hypothetical protein